MFRYVALFAFLCLFHEVTGTYYFWDGEAGDGIWDSANNWSPNGVPGEFDDVYIAAGDNITINNRNNSYTIRSLTVYGSLTFDNGKINVTDFLHLDGGTSQILSSANGNADKLDYPDGSATGNGIDVLSASSKPAGYSSGDAAFPVTISSFDAIVSNSSVSLEWTSAEENNFLKYEVERSFNANTFERIGNVRSNENNLYKFVDNLPFKGNNYYRLKMIDLDGSYEYSKIITANFIGNDGFKVFPNPIVGGMLKVNGLEQDETIDLFRLNGRHVDYQLIEGGIEINLNKLNSGEIIFLKTTLGNSAKVFME